MRGAVNGNAPVARVARVRLDPASCHARQEELPLDAEFPRIDPRRTGRRYRHVYPAERVDAPLGRPLFDSVTRLDVDTGRVQRHRCGASVLAEEHVFVPRPGSAREGEGWVIGSAPDVQRGACCARYSTPSTSPTDRPRRAIWSASCRWGCRPASSGGLEEKMPSALDGQARAAI